MDKELIKKLNARQKQIYEALSDIDRRLGGVYLGALEAKDNSNNPDNIAQSAHSIREITCIISRKAEVDQDQQEVAKTENSQELEEQVDENLVKKLVKFFDPNGLTTSQKVYRLWKKKNDKFVGIAHHQSQPPTKEEFEVMVEEFEDLLVNFVFKSQHKVLAEIDQLLKKSPEDINFDKLKLTLSKFSTCAYFYKNVGNNWLEHLDKNGLFSNPPLPVSDGTYVSFPGWPESEYLTRVAKDKPEVVFEIISKIQLSKNNLPEELNPRVVANFVEAFAEMPLSFSEKIIGTVASRKWIQIPYDFLVSDKLHTLLKKYIQNNQWDSARSLADILLEIRRVNPEEKLKYSRGNLRISYIDNWEYGEVLNTIKDIPVSHQAQFVKMLSKKLLKALSYEISAKGYENDYSSTWRPAIEDHSQNWRHNEIQESLLVKLRDSLEQAVSKIDNPKDCKKFLSDNLDQPKNIRVYDRVRLHIYRKFSGKFKDQIVESLMSSFNDTELWHEWSLLIKQEFGNLSEDDKGAILLKIHEGPAGEKEERYINYWKARRLSLIKNYLKGKELEKANGLLHNYEPETPEFLSTHSSWVGPTSPLSKTDLEKKTTQEIIAYIKSWTPPKGNHENSREGLGRILQEVIKERPEDFSKNSMEFANQGIHPNYIYNLFSGLRESIKNGGKIHWPEVIKLAGMIIDMARSSRLPEFEKEEDFDIDCDYLLKSIVDLLEDGMLSKDCPSTESKDDIYTVVSYLVEHSDPTPEYEEKYGGNNMDPFTLSLNTVRGQAFHALFAYMFWRNKQTKKKEIPTEVKSILEKHLNIGNEPSLTIRAVIGYFLPWLIIYDQDWVKENLSKILPHNDLARWFASWETYLTRSIYKNVFQFMQREYEYAIGNLKLVSDQNRRFWRDTSEALAQHVAIGYLYYPNIGGRDLQNLFSKKADPKVRGEAVSFIGRSYINGDSLADKKYFPKTSKLFGFWTDRLNQTNDIEELKEFGWWIKKGGLENDEKMLRLLNRTLEKTKGVIEAEFSVLEALSQLASDFPYLVNKAVYVMLNRQSKNNYHIYTHRDYLRDILDKTEKTKSTQAIALARKIREFMLNMGFEDYRQQVK